MRRPIRQMHACRSGGAQRGVFVPSNIPQRKAYLTWALSSTAANLLVAPLSGASVAKCGRLPRLALLLSLVLCLPRCSVLSRQAPPLRVLLSLINPLSPLPRLSLGRGGGVATEHCKWMIAHDKIPRDKIPQDLMTRPTRRHLTCRHLTCRHLTTTLHLAWCMTRGLT